MLRVEKWHNPKEWEWPFKAEGWSVFAFWSIINEGQLQWTVDYVWMGGNNQSIWRYPAYTLVWFPVICYSLCLSQKQAGTSSSWERELNLKKKKKAIKEIEKEKGRSTNVSNQKKMSCDENILI